MRPLRVLLAVLLVGGIGGCGSDSTHDAVPATAAIPPPDAPGEASDVSLWLNADRVPPGAFDVVGVLMNHSGVDVVFGVDAKVERWDGEGWVSQGRFVMCLDHWHCTAELQPPGDDIDAPGIGLIDSPGPMQRFTVAGSSPGWYRISQTANEGPVAAGVLEVAADSEQPAPLVPVDDPAISIHPRVVPTAGATVQLHPLIPAPSGSQAIGDVEAAIDGLSEAAQIDRWDGDRWVGAVQVALAPPQDATAARSPSVAEHEGSSVGRSAVIPALEEGAYRLVRTGPSGPHIGNFWVHSSPR